MEYVTKMTLYGLKHFSEQKAGYFIRGYVPERSEYSYTKIKYNEEKVDLFKSTEN